MAGESVEREGVEREVVEREVVEEVVEREGVIGGYKEGGDGWRGMV